MRAVTESSSFSCLSRFFERVKAFVSDYEEQKNSTTSREQNRSSSATAFTEQIQMTLQSQVHKLAQVIYLLSLLELVLLLDLFISPVGLAQFNPYTHSPLQLSQRIGVDDPAQVERDLKLVLNESDVMSVDDDPPGGNNVMTRRIPEAHFLRYMNALAARDFTTALEELQRYFDFGVCKGGDANAGLVGVPSRAGDSLHAHYAILNLAVLHFHFGSIL